MGDGMFFSPLNVGINPLTTPIDFSLDEQDIRVAGSLTTARFF